MYEFNQKRNGNANKTLELSTRFNSRFYKGWGYKKEKQCTTMPFIKASDWGPLNAGV